MAFREAVAKDFPGWIAPDQSHHAMQLAFAHSRLAEGRELAEHPYINSATVERPIRCLDVGSGNGGVAVALANVPRFRVETIDLGRNSTMERVRRSTGLPIGRTLGDVSALPFADETFDVVLLIDVVEHVRDRRRMGSEAMRVLKPGGVCFITTPARLRYFWRPDPHYGVRGLVILPNGLQRFIIDRVLRRRVSSQSGFPAPAYDVEHTFWHVVELARLFPGRKSVEALYHFPLAGGPPLSWEWWRRRLRGFVFHHVVIWKDERAGGADNSQVG